MGPLLPPRQLELNSDIRLTVVARYDIDPSAGSWHFGQNTMCNAR
jgi:hypothetical protein